MYFSQTTKERIKLMRNKHNISEKKLLEECSLGVNAIRQITDDKGIASVSLAKISDVLDCSMDYLMGRTDNPNAHKDQSSNTVNGNYNAVDNSSVTVTASSLNEHQKALLDIYNRLSPVQQAQLLVEADKMAEK